MLRWRVEVKEKDSLFPGFLQGLRQRKPPEEDTAECCSVHTWNAAPHRPCRSVVPQFLSLCWLRFAQGKMLEQPQPS